MKTIKCGLILITLLLAGLVSVANASLIYVSTRDVHPDNPSATEAAARTEFNNPNLIDCFRAESTGHFDITGVGIFDITLDPSLPNNDPGPTYTVSWSLTGGMVLEGVYFKGGSQGGNFYSAGETQSDTGTGHTPITGGSSKFADLSHLDFFATPGGASVPDGGATLMLLGAGFGGLCVVRRFIMC